MVSPAIQKDALMRRIEKIERDIRELGPSIAKSFGSTVAALQATVDALVATDSLQTGVGGFAVPTGTSSSVLAGTILIPDGYTRALVMVVGEVTANNGSGSAGYLYGRVFVNADDSGLHVSATTGNAEQATITLARSSQLTGLTPGGTVNLSVWAKGDSSAWGSTSTFAYLSALAIFTR